MRENIQISAVIPSYNREKTIAKAIDSILEQEYPASEIIVIDDGSKDNTRKIIENYGARVRYVYQENQGVSAARNQGVNEAKCEWIAFLDSDDYWLPEHLDHMVNAIERTEGVAGLYFCDLYLPPDEGKCRYWDRCGFKIDSPSELKRDGADWAFMRNQPMMLQASVIRKASYLEIGGLPRDLRTREDTLLFFKLGLLYPICAVSGCGAVMTSDGNTRLTQIYDSRSLLYWDASIFLYKEVLASVNSLRRERRKFITNSLSGSYYSVGRIFFQQKNYLSAIKNLIISGFISPSVFIKTFLDSLGRRKGK